MSWHKTGLNEYTPYRVTVMGATDRALTNASKEITVLTEEDGKYACNMFYDD